MKKLLLLNIGTALFTNTYAQVPKKVGTPIIHKITATWCNPCGTWGWDLANELIDATKDKALFIGIYSSPGTTYDNAKFYTKTAADLSKMIYPGGGLPSFGCNAINKTGSPIYPSVVKSDIIKAVDAFVAATPVASCANSMEITGAIINVDAKVKFWSAASGEYLLAAYMVEDKAKNKQNGHTGAVEHHDVLRGSMSATTWGEPLASGSIAANATYSQKFTFTITDANWIKDSLKIYTVIWKKKSATEYEFVNASTTEEAAKPSSIATISGVEHLKLIPNPASGGNTTLWIESTEKKSIHVTVVDYTGRSVYKATDISISTGQNSIEIPTGNFANGIYQVSIAAEDGQMTEQLSIIK